MGPYLQIGEGGGDVPVDNEPPGLDLAVQALEEDLEAHGVVAVVRCHLVRQSFRWELNVLRTILRFIRRDMTLRNAQTLLGLWRKICRVLSKLCEIRSILRQNFSKVCQPWNMIYGKMLSFLVSFTSANNFFLS